MDIDKPKRAFRDLESALEVCTSSSYSLLLQSQQCWVTKRLQEAWQYINESIRVDSNNPKAYHFRAYLQSLLSSGPGDEESFEKERADYDKIMNSFQYKRLAIVHNNLGYLCYEKRSIDEALEHFAKSLELCPHNVQAYYNRSIIFSELNQIGDALRETNFLLAINPNLEDGIVMKGSNPHQISPPPPLLKCFLASTLLHSSRKV